MIGIAVVERGNRLAQRLMNHRRARALLGAQVAIARTERQSVGCAYRRRTDDIHRQRQIERHVPHHQQLLVVLLAEHRDVGRDDAE